MLTLGFESSCDDTAVALVEDGVRVLTNRLSSQIEVHRRFGGVVPEVASRKHLEAVTPMLGETLAAIPAGAKIGLVAATAGPGLLGALLVGLSAAKGAAVGLQVPLVPVNHLEAHLTAAFLGAGRPPVWPFLGVVVSGGHALVVRAEAIRRFTVVARTHDDAPGELFDKVARVLGLGYPGGPVIERAAAGGDPGRYRLPRPMADQPAAMSFSGLKTAVINLHRQEGERLVVPDLCASLQETVAASIDDKIVAALTGWPEVRALVLAGGVAANQCLRRRLAATAAARGCEFLVPPMALCTDNAAMIAAHGHWVLAAGAGSSSSAAAASASGGLAANAAANWPMGGPDPT